MKTLICPKNYKAVLDVKQTEIGIKHVKDFFQLNLSAELRLRRVTAPLFVEKGTGINDDLNGVERPVSFEISDMPGIRAEIVHSLAKWKRMNLADLHIGEGYGLYVDMNAIRADEELGNIHSLYVDQWDWERVITKEQRTIDFFKKKAESIYEVMKRTEFYLFEQFPDLEPVLPDSLSFIHAEQLLQKYPDLEPKDREDAFLKEQGAACIMGIGAPLSNGKPHDGRAPDYDDWITKNDEGYQGLNGDILVWNPILECAFEISSMGVRVDKNALIKQLTLTGNEDRKDLFFHKRLIEDQLPLSIGGGIGQSRLCMFFLKKAHIGEIQVSLWPKKMIEQCRDHSIYLL